MSIRMGVCLAFIVVASTGFNVFIVVFTGLIVAVVMNESKGRSFLSIIDGPVIPDRKPNITDPAYRAVPRGSNWHEAAKIKGGCLGHRCGSSDLLDDLPKIISPIVDTVVQQNDYRL
jgi:hypothetical protein